MDWRAKILALGLAAACGSTSRQSAPISSRASRTRDPALSLADRCAMIDAAFSLEAFREFACGEAATRGRRVLVDVEVEPRFAPDEDCSSNVFAIYRVGDRTNTDALLQLVIGPIDSKTWEFSAMYTDPENSPNDHRADGMDGVNYYCVFVDGRLGRTNAGWRAWIDHSR